MLETQKDELKKIAHNQRAMEALRLLSEEVLSIKNILNETQAETNEIIGQKVRAIEKAHAMFNSFFSILENYKEEQKLDEQGNPVF